MKALDSYPYCGHSGLLGKIKREMSMTEIANLLGLTQPAVKHCGKTRRRNRKAEGVFSF
ncbi:MAG: hypothetical protein ABF291_00920 [Desulfobacterales bacterium]